MLGKQKQGGFYYPKDYPKRFITFVSLYFKIKAFYRWFRVQSIWTSFLGFQYKPSKDLIEIDITYLCNLRCNNCNRSSAQAPEASHISLADIRKFVTETIDGKRHWRRIRILGGEPTLHPEFLDIIQVLLKLKEQGYADVIEVVSNGFGPKVKRALAQIPDGIELENSEKAGNTQPMFGPFNLAPKDDYLHKFSDFRHGCDIMHSCGIGLTPLGYFPCAVAGGIDRVTEGGCGRDHLPHDFDEMRDLLARNCQLCGRFKDGHYVPEKLRPALLEQKTSRSWLAIYKAWRTRKHQEQKDT
ncbi:radical SAM protein [Pseudoalteromonas sp. G4]|uniref:radical SAM protein n=1 Tax=Pseudoalteromonas sp. G4 TaxID=2992761 RepID=UPI00237E5C8F|nr:radical SAM protein [Pseudoalteromonas sp. G4]MDE3271399.1 radical SAM protein [Pseudoalteromonas sp. G4]